MQDPIEIEPSRMSVIPLQQLSVFRVLYGVRLASILFYMYVHAHKYASTPLHKRLASLCASAHVKVRAHRCVALLLEAAAAAANNSFEQTPELLQLHSGNPPTLHKVSTHSLLHISPNLRTYKIDEYLTTSAAIRLDTALRQITRLHNAGAH